MKSISKKMFYLSCLALINTSYAITNNKNEESNKKTYTLKIEDKDHLSTKKEVIFINKQDLVLQLKLLLSDLINDGYVTSSIKSDDGVIKVIGGRIDKVILQDSSTFFPELKKHIFGLNLSDRILNIADINKIVEKYNKNKTNHLKVSIVNSDKPYYSNIIFKNNYEFSIKPDLQIEHYSQNKGKYYQESLNRYQAGVNIEQLLGFNDRLRLNVSLDKKEKNYLASYNIYLYDIDFNLLYYMQNKKHKLFKNVFLYNNSNYLSLTATKEKNIDPTLLVSKYIKFSRENERQKIKNTEVHNRIFLQSDLGLYIRKYLLQNNSISTLLFSPSIALNLGKQKNREDNLCLMSSNTLGFYSKYYNANVFLGYSKLIDGKYLYDKCAYTNKLNKFDNIPLVYDSFFVGYINNMIKYPIKIKEIQTYPFLEVAVGKDWKKNKSLSGFSSGLIFSWRDISFGTKYSYTEKERSITMKFNLKF